MQIADDLRRRIASGSLAEGEQLPSARELMEHHSVSNTAAQNALRQLRNEGLTYSVQGRGTFVLADGTAAEKAKDLAGSALAGRSADRSPEYLELRGELDRLADEVERIHQRLDEMATSRAPKARRTPAKKS